MRLTSTVLIVVLTAVAGCGGEDAGGTTDWRAILREPTLEPSDLVRAVTRAIRERNPRLTVSVRGESELAIVDRSGSEFSAYLDNVGMRLRSASPSDRPAILELWLNALPPLSDEATEEDMDPADILPVIRPESYVAALRRQSGGTFDPLMRTFVADLRVLYVLDSPERMQTLDRLDLEQLGLTEAALYARATRNLEEVLDGAEIQPSEGLHVIDAGGTYETSLLLFPRFWRDWARDVEGDLIAAAPTRGVVMFAGLDDVEATTRMRTDAGDLHAKGPHPITPKLLRWTGDRWVIHQP